MKFLYNCQVKLLIYIQVMFDPIGFFIAQILELTLLFCNTGHSSKMLIP